MPAEDPAVADLMWIERPANTSKAILLSVRTCLKFKESADQSTTRVPKHQMAMTRIIELLKESAKYVLERALTRQVSAPYGSLNADVML